MRLDESQDMVKTTFLEAWRCASLKHIEHMLYSMNPEANCIDVHGQQYFNPTGSSNYALMGLKPVWPSIIYVVPRTSVYKAWAHELIAWPLISATDVLDFHESDPFAKLTDWLDDLALVFHEAQ